MLEVQNLDRLRLDIHSRLEEVYALVDPHQPFVTVEISKCGNGLGRRAQFGPQAEVPVLEQQRLLLHWHELQPIGPTEIQEPLAVHELPFDACGVPCITTVQAADAAVKAMEALREESMTVQALQDRFAGVEFGGKRAEVEA